MATRFDNLLDEFHKLPPRAERRPTFMEIAGCAHKENACSDILAFFCDPGRPHGLGALFLEALAQVGGIQNQEASDVSVGREVTTKAGNQIDLLIQSDSHAILIENKIWASIDSKRYILKERFNYAEDLGRIASEVRKVVCKLAKSNGAA